MRFVPGTEISGAPAVGLDAPARLPAVSAGAEPLATRIRAIADYRAQPQPAHRRAAQRARLRARVGRRRAAREGPRRPPAHRRGARRRGPRRDACRRRSTACSPTASRPTSTPARSAPRRRSSSSPRAAERPCSRTPTRCAWATPSSSASSRELAGHGLRGVECFRPDHDDAQRAFTRRLCAQLGLVPTGGSDWHGRPDGLELGDVGPGAAARGHARAARLRMSTPSG